MENLSSILFNPVVFLGFCAIIIILALGIAIFYVFNSANQEKNIEKERSLEREAKEKEYAGLINKNAEIMSLVESLKNQISLQAKEIQEIDRLREELQKKEAAYRTEALTKEKYASDLKNTQSQLSVVQDELVALKSKPEVEKNDPAVLEQLQLELKNKEELLRNETLTKDKFWAELKTTESQILNIQNELKSSQEVYQGLKEQYADLERQVDVLNQQIALEKSLYVRLSEEHELCKKIS